MSHSHQYTHYRTCNLCEAMCGIAIDMDGGTILSIKGDKNDPFSQGHICPKATALQDIYRDPDRLKHPMRRTANGWERISWDDAYREVAENVKRVQAAHGVNAVGIYLGNPNVHNLGSMLVGPTLTRALRTTNRFSATSVDQLPHHVAARHMFGHYFRLPIPDIDHTDFFLIMGANPLASNGSLMTAPGVERRIKAIQKRGGKVVVVDPRQTATAKIADQHLFIQPGYDVLLLLSLIHTLFAERLVDLGRLAEIVEGVAEIEQIAARFSAETTAPVLNIPADTIQQLARDFAAADSAVCYGRMGLSTQAFGGACQWLINTLNILTGNFDEAGGAMFTTPAFDAGISPRRAGKMGRWRSRVRDLPEAFGELPVATMAEEILTEGDDQIRAMVTVAGNPILSTPNGGQLEAAFAQLDFMVSIDIYINETTRHANIILPPTTGLETAHYDVVFHALAVRNTAKYSPPLFEAADDTRHDWQIFRELTRALASEERPFDETHPLNAATPEQMLDFGLRAGPYGPEGLTLDKLKANPHGIDLGPLQSQLPDHLLTPKQTIDLAHNALTKDVTRIAQLLDRPTTDEFDLALIGRRDLRSNNSWMHNSERLVRGKARCTVLLHPDDAAARDIVSGQMVEVASRVGKVRISAEITPTIKRGVVSMPHGWGHGRDGVRLRVAQANAGVSINDLTDDKLIDTLTGNAALSGVPVRVTAIVEA